MDLPPAPPSRWNPVAFVLWRRRLEPDFSLQFAWLLLVGLSLCAVGAVGLWRQYERGRSWREVEGTSTRVDFTAETVRSRTGSSHTRWQVQVVYRYRVGEREWLGNRIHETPDADKAWSEGERESFAQRFAPGSSLRVFVDPSNPSEAMLEPSVDYMGGVRWLLLGLLLAVPGAILTLGPVSRWEAHPTSS